MLEHRAPQLVGRSQHVESAAVNIAGALTIPDDMIYALRLAAAFHDIGLLAVPDGTIQLDRLLEGVLSPELVPHLVLGGRLVHHAFPDYPDAVEAIWYHHEWWDGRGPFGLREDQIPLPARIIALVDAMVYRYFRGDQDAAGFDAVVHSIKSEAGGRFDPGVVSALLRIFNKVRADLTSIADGPDGGGVLSPIISDAIDDEPIVPGAVAASVEPTASSCGGNDAGTVHRHKAALAALRSKSAICEPAALIARIRAFDSPESWSPAIQGVLRVTQSSGCSARDVSKAVSQDPLLAMRVLRLANNSPFARHRNVDTILDAVTVLGINEIRNLALTCQVFDRFGSGEIEEIDPERFWVHSAACGLIAVHLGTADPGIDPFVSGILHDAGRLILLRAAPEEYAEVVDVSQRLELPLEVVEDRLIGTTHATVIGELMKHWGFGARLGEIVAMHHESARSISRLRKDIVRDVATIAIANRIAHALSMGASGNDRLYSIADLTELLKFDEGQLRTAIDATEDRLPSMHAVMALSATSASGDGSKARRGPQLANGVIPLVVSDEPQTSALALYCRGAGMVAADGALPTIALACVDSNGSAHRIMRRLVSLEQAAGVANLPTIIVAGGPSIDECPELRHRRHVVLKSPVRRDLLVEQINAILNPGSTAKSPERAESIIAGDGA